MSLDDINKLEQDILSVVTKNYDLGGTIEEKTMRLSKAGVFSTYTKIHQSYVEIIKTGSKESRVEALKRALYIQWVGSFEPSFITGITTSFVTYERNDDGLKIEEVSYVYEFIDNLIKQDKLDDELRDMLSYYAGWDFIFEWNGFDQFIALNKFIKSKANDNRDFYLLIKERELDDRGQMGKYFKSLGA